MGGGLVLFGIGGEVEGGLLDAFRENQGSSKSVFSEQVEQAERRVQANRRDANAWAQLARVRYQEAVGVGLNEETGEFTDEGRKILAEADRAWQRSLKLTDDPDPGVAATMVQLYSAGALNKPDQAVKAYEIQLEATEQPTWQMYATWAQLAYLAGDKRKGDLAGAKAIRKAPKDERKRARQVIEAAKAQAAQATSSTATTPSG